MNHLVAFDCSLAFATPDASGLKFVSAQGSKGGPKFKTVSAKNNACFVSSSKQDDDLL